jgi:hypothetical protein
MDNADIIGWVADLLNDLRPGNASDLTVDDLIGISGGEDAAGIVEL